MKETLLASFIRESKRYGWKEGYYFSGQGSIKKGSHGRTTLDLLIKDKNLDIDKYDFLFIEGARNRYASMGSQYCIMYKKHTPQSWHPKAKIYISYRLHPLNYTLTYYY
ncbi:MAG: hypothetical protein Q4F74_02415 [Synergistaceae bacterium]|nr:hypothetical protein [Synergistaceae bacterium]